MADKWKQLVTEANSKTAMRAVWDMILRGLGRGPVEVVLQRPKRSLSQNDKMWPMLRDISRQKQMLVNGVWEWAGTEDWKIVFTAALKRQQRMTQGIDGGVVVLGMSTSQLPADESSNLIEIMYAYGSEHGINWSEPSIRAYESYREALQ